MLIDFCKNTSKPIYIYGVCDRAFQIREYLSRNGIRVEGYLVSESYKNACSEDNVFTVKEIVREDIAVVLALQYRHYNEIIPGLITRGIKEIYFLMGKDLLLLQKYDSFYTVNTDINKVYFDREESYLAALEIFEFLFRHITVRSVIEFGCGCGAWLKAVKKLVPKGVVLGIDGSDVDRSEYLDEKEFQKEDITTYRPQKRYDLAVSIEVAEHLDEVYADQFVENLCLSSDIVLFSAAVRNQGGQHHVNEQNQSYWRDRFQKYGYIPVDCIRPRFWNDIKIPVYYKQNCILYVRDLAIRDQFQTDRGDIFDMVHPELLDMKWQAVLNGTI